MKEQEVLILVFVVLVIAVVMMKKPKDTKPSGGGGGTPKVPTEEEKMISKMQDKQYVYGTVKPFVVVNNQDTPPQELVIAGTQVRITKVSLFGAGIFYALSGQTTDYDSLSVQDKRDYTHLYKSVETMLAEIQIDLTSGIMGP